MKFLNEYPRPAITVDCVVFGLDQGRLKVLLIQRKIEPFIGSWALPGGFVRIDETLEDAAIRELKEESNLSKVYLEQLATFGAVERDPRGRIVTVAYYALAKSGDHNLVAATDAAKAAWFDFRALPDVAFDHKKIILCARERLRAKVRYAPIGFELLPEKFTLSELQLLYELLLEKTLDKRNFRRKILSMELLIETESIQKNASHRAAKFYRFDKKKYQKLEKTGFTYAI